ncbi:MAG: 3-hydroxyacyl-CoA dehydrogenase [Gammaproteobacteria bacterium HGW-Gammaproteobacteria-3]|nr:MAG: 3-hydroxyacyl-CoA dehydrogenase [Gammaproteobacteria bacterium HGW-Gammaproteobacteria-3]
MSIEKVAVIGAGVMGAGIAAHVANAGIAVDLLDIVPKDGNHRNAIAENAIAKLLKTEPAAFMHLKNARLLNPGNIEDHLDRLAQADWVIEAVIENPGIKQALYQKLETVCRPDTLISSNTSTLPLSLLTRDLPDSFKRRFMITHFFNPPRYMRLLELVAAPELDVNLFNTVNAFADHKLGKGCVVCNDTPGFIANRIGTFWIQTALIEAIAMNLTVEQCDAAMALVGIPKTGVFGLMDLVGLDLMPHILETFRHSLSANDRLRAIAAVPPLLQGMIAKGLTGRKGEGGFYRLQPGAKHKIKESIDLQSGEYRVSEKFQIKGVSHKAEDLRTFLSADEALNRYTWRVLSETLSYSASLIPEIADNIVAVDTAMRLGYNWRYGPFEWLDRLGVDWFIDKLLAQNQAVPYLLADRQSLYRSYNGQLQFKDTENHYQPLQRPEGVLLLSDIKRRSSALLSNASASLWDLGDAIACFEFHSKMNTLDPDILNLLQQSLALLAQDFKGLVIHNEAENFSAGANLTLLMPAIVNQDWATVKAIIRLGQQTYQALKYAPFPVVGAPSGLALGGGCEILLHCDALVAHAELYTGLVEVGVGLVPGWGGCKELLRRWLAFPKRPGGPLPPIAQTFETIGLAKVSKSAQEARDLLFLSKTDSITMNKDRLLADAKHRAVALAENYRPPELFVYSLPGKSGWSALDIAVHNLHLAGKASAYDVEISRQLAVVLSGGDTGITRPLTEQDLLDLELEAFLTLVKQPSTLARLEHMLKTGKPLRN